MTLLHKPVGIWLLGLWSICLGLPALYVATETGGLKGILALSFFAMQVFLVVGLAIRLTIARYILVASLAANVFLLGILVWVFVFVASAWGLRGSDAPAVVPVVAYHLFVCWGFIYLLHPDIAAYFRGYVNESAA